MESAIVLADENSINDDCLEKNIVMKKIMGMTFTYPMSLEEWVRLGLFDREKRIYEEHLRQGNFDEIVWFTYGHNDGNVCRQLQENGKLDKRIRIVCSPRWAKGKMLKYLYSVFIPYIHSDICRSLSVIKSNQMQGAVVAASIGKKYHIPFVFRTGYTFTLFYKRRTENECGIKKIKARYWLHVYSRQEQRLYEYSDIAFVSSNEDKQYIVDKYNINTDKMFILTNYIDCDLFSPKKVFSERKERFLFVGRLDEQKNLRNLLLAFKEMDIGIDLYGVGAMEEELKSMILEEDDIVLKGKVSNDKLADIYNDYKYFILPSLYEGMPKTLLEAMACGCVCFGTNVEGIREVLDGQNGILLSSTDSDSIKNTITKIVKAPSDEVHLEKYGNKAVSYIREKHVLEEIVKIEKKLLI